MSESTTLIDQVVAGANAATRVNEGFDAASPGLMYGRRASTTTGLTWGYYGGRFSSTLVANGTVALTASSSNYVVASRSTGAVSVSTSTTNWNDTANYARLYLVVTGSVAATSYEDHRQAIAAAAPGGGGLTNITEGVETTGVNTPTTVVSLTASQEETNVDFSIVPKGTGALLTKTPDGAATGGNKRGSQAVDLQLRRNAAGQVASGAEAVLTGGYNNTASGAQSGVFDGRDNTASGALSSVLGGFSNTVSGGQSSIGGGGSNSITVTYSGIFSGSGNTINGSGDYGFVGGGSGNLVSGDRAAITGGASNTASGQYSFVPGGSGATTRAIRGAGAHSAGSFSTQGDAQAEVFVLYRGTTDATPTQMSSSNAAAGASNSIVLPNTSLYTFDALVSVRQNSTGDAASFRVTGAIKRGASAATAALVGTPVVTAVGADAGAAAWAVAATADTTLGALAITVTGEAAKTLRWVARVVTAEVVG